MLSLVGYTSIARTIYTPNGTQVPQNSIGTYPEEEWLYTCDYQLQNIQDNVSNGVYGSSCVVISGYSRQYNYNSSFRFICTFQYINRCFD